MIFLNIIQTFNRCHCLSHGIGKQRWKYFEMYTLWLLLLCYWPRRCIKNKRDGTSNNYFRLKWIKWNSRLDWTWLGECLLFNPWFGITSAIFSFYIIVFAIVFGISSKDSKYVSKRAKHFEWKFYINIFNCIKW